MAQIGHSFYGGLHGLFNCLNRLFKKSWEKLGIVTQWIITFMLVNMLWILFRADDIRSAGLFIKEMCSLNNFAIRQELYQCFDLIELTFLEVNIPLLGYISSRITGIHLWMFVLGAFFIVLNFRNSKEIEFKPTIFRAVVTVIFMFWSVISLSGVSTFLYFDF